MPKSELNANLFSTGKIRNFEFIKELLSNQSGNTTEFASIAFLIAAEKGYTDFVKLLLEDTRVNPAAKKYFEICIVDQNGHKDVYKFLLEDARVDPAVNDNYAIRLAAEKGHTDVVKRLLEDARVNPSAKDNHAIRFAARNGHTNIVKLLLENKIVDPAADNNYAICVAAQNGHTDVVSLLLQDKRVNAAANNNSPLMLALQHKHYDVAQILVNDLSVSILEVQNDFSILKEAERKSDFKAASLLLPLYVRQNKGNEHLLKKSIFPNTYQKAAEYSTALFYAGVSCRKFANKLAEARFENSIIPDGRWMLPSDLIHLIFNRKNPDLYFMANNKKFIEGLQAETNTHFIEKIKSNRALCRKYSSLDLVSVTF